ncbi:MAG: polyhydroxyalkanoate depolymerase, partial [Methylocapsa sp.]|nr:polyhydroxyalkanoate depolymerase [Methylocapsa sp.]
MPPFAYELHELTYFALAPVRALTDVARTWLESPINPVSYTSAGRNLAASAKVFERLTRRYDKPAFGLSSVTVEGALAPVAERVIWERPFCKLLHFEKQFDARSREPQQKLLMIAPLSGHHATLLRGTVEAFLPYYDVFITDWIDARTAPLEAGPFGLDDYIDYVTEMCAVLSRQGDGRLLHTMGVCQPAVPLIAAVALMEAEDSPHIPESMTLMGGPIDTRRSPTKVNLLAQERGSAWFKHNCVCHVPFGYRGAGREVYPGFLQLTGFMAMNIDRHVTAHLEFFDHLVKGDGDSARKHREFYDEYRAVMDLPAEFYLQTVDTVFVRHALPKGQMTHRGTPVDLRAIRRAGLLTVEGGNDDISGIGQTQAAQDLCSGIPPSRKADYLQKNVGHYGVFNGSRFRNEVVPRVREFHR